MSLFFKSVDKELLHDPGSELQKVIDFKNTLIRDRPILFQECLDRAEIEKRTRKLLSLYVSEKSAAAVDIERAQSRSTKGAASEAEEGTPGPAEGSALAFLDRVSESANSPLGFHDLAPTEVARMRLLSASISMAGNDLPTLGVHDANLLFKHRKEVALSPGEIYALFSTALQSFASETVPLWHWVNSIASGPANLVWQSAFNDSQEAQVGSLTAMWLAGTPIYINETFERSFFVEKWFESKVPAVKVAALKYLADHGLEEDLPFIEKERDGAEFSTKTPAIESIIRILLRHDGLKAAEVAVQNSFDRVGQRTLVELKEYLPRLSRECLLRGVGHSNGTIRDTCVSSLLSRFYDDKIIQTLLIDDRPSVRFEAVKALFEHGNPLPLDEVKARLSKPDARPSLLFGSSETGEKEVSRYVELALRERSKDDLIAILSGYDLDDKEAFSALYFRYFRELGDELRNELRNRFRSWFDGLIAHYERSFGSAAVRLIEQTKSLDDFLRGKRIQAALDIIAAKGSSEDLDLVRELAVEGPLPAADLLAQFMGSHGTFDDIAVLVKTGVGSSSGGFFGSKVLQDNTAFVVDAILKLGKGRLAEVLELEMPAKLKIAVIDRIPSAQFKQMDMTRIARLLAEKDDNVRKAACLRFISTFPKKIIAIEMSDYLEQDTYFYNVAHWLDFGISNSMGIVKEAVTRVRASAT